MGRRKGQQSVPKKLPSVCARERHRGGHNVSLRLHDEPRCQIRGIKSGKCSIPLSVVEFASELGVGVVDLRPSATLRQQAPVRRRDVRLGLRFVLDLRFRIGPGVLRHMLLSFHQIDGYVSSELRHTFFFVFKVQFNFY